MSLVGGGGVGWDKRVREEGFAPVMLLAAPHIQILLVAVFGR